MIHHKTVHHKHNLPSGKRIKDNLIHDQKTYYWIWFDKDGAHKGLWGYYLTYEQADRKAASSLNVPYEIVALNTTDEGEASRRLRSRVLEETRDVEKTFKRFSHRE